MNTYTINTTEKFTELYSRLREKEGRMYSDAEVANLPFIDSLHPKYNEWKIRASSFKRLNSYLVNKNSYLDILEVGCGNGWLCAKLATIMKGEVYGIDINKHELVQAKRVFHKIKNLHFLNGDLHDPVLENKKFDIIIFAASIQYFSSLKEIIDEALTLLAPGGEIHILDSQFYQRKDVDEARMRTKNYYSSMAFEELSEFYFHHALEDLHLFKFKILQNPHSWKNKLMGNKLPFYWIVVKHN